MEDHEPCPTSSGFASECNRGGYAGEVEQDEQHECEGRQRRETCSTEVTAIEDSQGRDDSLLRRQTGQQTNRHLPIETEWFQ